MVDVRINWTKIKELPAQVSSWTDLKYYAPDVVFPKKQCVYAIRLSPPFMVHYTDPKVRGGSDFFASPLIYVGSGNSQGRLGSHLKWLSSLGQALPGVRFEIWFCEPKVQKNAKAYKAFEGYLLQEFLKISDGWLPLRNKKIESANSKHNYGGAFAELIKHDRRYTWAIWPHSGKWATVYQTGGI